MLKSRDQKKSLSGAKLKSKAHKSSGQIKKKAPEPDISLKKAKTHRNPEQELKQLNRTLKALSKSSQAMMKAADEQMYLDAVCKIIVEDCGHKMVWIGYAQDDKYKSVRPVAYSGFEQGYLEKLKISWDDIERGRGPTGTAIRTGRISNCQNMLTDPKFEPWRKEAIKRGYASSIVLPLKNVYKIFGALSIYSEEPDPFTKDEVQLLAELANDLAFGIMTIRLREAQQKAEKQLQDSNEELSAINEELSASNEELRGAHEQLANINLHLEDEIEERKHAEAALRESEQRIKKKLDSILLPEEDVGELELSDIIDSPAIQSLMDYFYSLSKMPMAIIDVRGKVLVGVGWQDICIKFHRVNPLTCKFCIESDTQLSAGVGQDEFKVYKCKNNMWDVATPILVGGKHLGNLFTGQFFFEDEPIDYGFFRKQAKLYGFDIKEYISALERVPRINKETLNTGMLFFRKLADILSKLSYSNIKLARSMHERRLAEEALQKAHNELEMRVEERTAELNKAAELAKAERRRFFDVLETLPVYVCLLTPDYGMPFANKVFREWFGYLADKKCHEFLFGRKEPCENCQTYNVLKTGGPQRWEWTGSNSRNYDIYDFPFKDTDGSQLILEMGIDITERKQAERALQEINESLEQRVIERTAELAASEDRLKRAQEISHLGSWELDLNKNKLTWSDEVYRIFGLKPQEFGATYETFLEHVHPDDRAAVDEAYSSSVRKNLNNYEIEHRIIRKGTGEIRIVHEKCEHFRDAEGKIIRSAGMVHDITERKQAEDALRETEHQFRIMTEAVPGIVWTAEPDGTTDYYNHRWYEYSGLPADAPESAWKETIHPEDRDDLAQVWANSVQCGGVYNVEHRIRRADGQYRWHLSRAIPLKDESGKIKKWFGISMDIDEQKRSLEELERISGELEGKNDELESIIRIASHDLRSPLVNIKGFSGELAKDIKKASEAIKAVQLPQDINERLSRIFEKFVPEAVGFIQNSAESINQMLKSLTHVAKAGTVPISVRDIDMNTALEKIVETLNFKLKESGVRLAIEPLPVCRGDSDQIGQVFMNLIDNAIKYRDPEKSALIRVYGSADGNTVTYCVEDNGKGIAEEYHDKIFNLFTRLDPEAAKGEGLGLTIAKRIVERQGGKIWLHSAVGKGSKFFVMMPR